MMDHGACNVVYLDRRARDEHVYKNMVRMSLASIAYQSTEAPQSPGYFKLAHEHAAEVRANIDTILSVFGEGKSADYDAPMPRMLITTRSAHLQLRRIMSLQNQRT